MKTTTKSVALMHSHEAFANIMGLVISVACYLQADIPVITHSNYWLLGNTNSETTSSEDLFQAQTYQALEDYHTHLKWKETEDPGQSYKRFHFWD